jgi:XTP/dITP diphosphohydrolase
LIEFYFATGNEHKIEEANAVLLQHKIQVKKLEGYDKIEIQHPNLNEISSAALTLIVSKFKGKVIVEDSGLFIHSLNGFPGPYSNFAFETLGVEGILKLLEGSKSRKAEFRSSVSFGNDGQMVAQFSSVTEGNIAPESRGSNGFGFDPIFIPMWTGKTFAEMELKEKTVYSHRAKALAKLALWYLNEQSVSSRQAKDAT